MRNQKTTQDLYIDVIQPPNSYHRENDNSEQPTISRWKVKVYFHDGGMTTKYSYDRIWSYELNEYVKDEYAGIKKLMAMCNKWREAKRLKKAVFYLCLDKTPLTAKKNYNTVIGRWDEHSRKMDNRISFIDSMLNLEKFEI